MLPDNILFSRNPAGDLKAFLNKKNYSNVVVVADENTTMHCLPLLQLTAEPLIEITSGEENKTIHVCELIWGRMTDLNLDRHALLVIVGGGVLGDMAGFCAATYKRGIDFVLIPTTLLAQVDASIGGKLGVDFRSYKNHIGVFQQPALTMVHSGFLRTLPRAELRSGFAEVLKHCLISDKTMWNVVVSRTLDDQDWDELTEHSVLFKARVTTEDPREKGLRKILNAGHTIGHAVESHLLSSGRKILHGEAIAIGLIAEAWIAYQRKLLTHDELHQVTSAIRRFFDKVQLSKEDNERAAELTSQDKKNKAQKILCVLPKGIGDAVWDIEISVGEVIASLDFYQEV